MRKTWRLIHGPWPTRIKNLHVRYNNLRWVPMCQGFIHSSAFLHHFVMAKLASSSIRVKSMLSAVQLGDICCSGFNPFGPVAAGITINPFTSGDTLTLLVANLVNTRWCRKRWKWLKPWHMGAHLIVLSKSLLMNTNIYRVKIKLQSLVVLCLGLSSIPTEPMHRYKSLAIYRIDKAATVSIK